MYFLDFSIFRSYIKASQTRDTLSRSSCKLLSTNVLIPVAYQSHLTVHFAYSGDPTFRTGREHRILKWFTMLSNIHYVEIAGVPDKYALHLSQILRGKAGINGHWRGLK